MTLPTKAAVIAYLGDIAMVLGPLAALPYTMGDAADILPPKVKLYVTIACAFSAAALKLVQRIMERLQGKQDRQQIQETKDALALPASSTTTP